MCNLVLSLLAKDAVCHGVSPKPAQVQYPDRKVVEGFHLCRQLVVGNGALKRHHLWDSEFPYRLQRERVCALCHVRLDGCGTRAKDLRPRRGPGVLVWGRRKYR